MLPPKRGTRDFEKVKIGEFVHGVIKDIKYEEAHEFNYKGEKKINPAVRIQFDLEGCVFPHYSRWLTFSYGEKANLYKMFIVKLVENARPDMEFDLDKIKGMRIKTIWNETKTDKGTFQNLELIAPEKSKIVLTVADIRTDEVPLEDEEPGIETPF